MSNIQLDLTVPGFGYVKRQNSLNKETTQDGMPEEAC